MNILMLVTSILMLLTILTYGRIDSFRGFSFVQFQFEEYIKKGEREYSNKKTIKNYEKLKASSGPEKNNETNSASSKLSFQLFVDEKERQAHPKEFEENLQIAKNLLYILYGEQPFFQEMEELRPNFIDDIFIALARETDQKLAGKKEIANIDLKDFELNDVFTNMLKGAENYPSLLDFITIRPDKLQLRVFLASKPLLLALFGNPMIVEDIVAKRNELYNTLIRSPKGSNFKAIGSQEFKELFSNYRLPFVSEHTLNFGISKTDPKPYN